MLPRDFPPYNTVFYYFILVDDKGNDFFAQFK